MEAIARAKYIRMAPRKSRLVIDMIRGKKAVEAAVILQFSTREASKAILKVLKSAIANAGQKGASSPDDLVITQAYVDEGPTLKRFRPRAQGRASRINKRTSHITIVLTETEKPKTNDKKDAAETKTAKTKPEAKKKPAAPTKKAVGAKKASSAKATEDKPQPASKAIEKEPAKPDALKESGKKEDSSGSEG